MASRVLDLSKIQRELDALHPGIPLDDVDRATRVKIMTKIMELFPAMLDLIHSYQMTIDKPDEE